MLALTNTGIDQAVTEAEAYLQECRIDAKTVLRLRLMLEEVLLHYQDRFGADDVPFSLRKRNIFGRVQIILNVPGESCDPFATDDEDALLLRRLYSDYDGGATWTYQNGANVVSFTAQRKYKISDAQKTLLSIVLAIVIGVACNFLPETARKALLESFVTPTFNAVLGVISAVAGPMVFLSLLWSVNTLGDVQTLSKIGSRMIRRFLLGLLLCAILAVALILPFFGMQSGGAAAFQAGDFYQLFLDIIPNNMVEPFVTGNTQQLIFLSIVLGVALLTLGNKVSALTTLVEQGNLLISDVMRMVNPLLPSIVFLSVLQMSLERQFSALARVYKLPILFLCAQAALALALTALTAAGLKVKAALLLKKAMPTFLRALTTSSSSAAMQLNMDTCRKSFGIDKKIVNFGVPLGQTVFMPGATLTFACIAFSMSDLYGVPITPQWLAVCVMTCVLLAVAAPPVVGSSAICNAILFRQLGIPEEGIGLALLFSMFSEYLETGVNVYALQMELTNLAASLDMLDRDTLRGET